MDITTDTDPILAHIERHLKVSGLSPTAFSKSVANDGRLVRDIRRGRQPRWDIRRKVLAEIARWQRANKSPEAA